MEQNEPISNIISPEVAQAPPRHTVNEAPLAVYTQEICDGAGEISSYNSCVFLNFGRILFSVLTVVLILDLLGTLLNIVEFEVFDVWVIMILGLLCMGKLSLAINGKRANANITLIKESKLKISFFSDKVVVSRKGPVIDSTVLYYYFQVKSVTFANEYTHFLLETNQIMSFFDAGVWEGDKDFALNTLLAHAKRKINAKHKTVSKNLKSVYIILTVIAVAVFSGTIFYILWNFTNGTKFVWSTLPTVPFMLAIFAADYFLREKDAKNAASRSRVMSLSLFFAFILHATSL